MNTIPENTLEALDFQLSSLNDFQKGVSQFVDVTNNLDLTNESVDNDQPIRDSEDEKIRKQKKCAAKTKVQLDNLHTSIRALVASFTTLFLSCSRSSTCLSSLSACFGIATALLSHLMLTPVPRSLIILLFFAVLSLTSPQLAFIALKTFKQTLLDKLLCYLTSLAELFLSVSTFWLIAQQNQLQIDF